MVILATEAARWSCPMARTFKNPEIDGKCIGQGCPVWRWIELPASSPEFREAVKKVAEEIGDKLPYAKAAAVVVAEKAKYGLTTTSGYCGLGGKP